MKRRRSRSLLPEEMALWRFVTRSVKPLPGHDIPSEPRPPDPPPAKSAAQDVGAKVEKGARAPSNPPRKVAEQRPPAPPPLAPLERRHLRDLRRGIREIDARIDLHGMRQAEAHHALVGFLRRAQAQGARVVLVVTGKGDISGHADPFVERGVLRRLTPQWLDQPDLRPVVVGYSQASREHGGIGAMYVRLRRPASGRKG